MRYLCLIYGEEKAQADAGQEAWDALYQQHEAFSTEAGAAGVLRGGEALKDTDTATTVQAVDGEVLTTDGPFAETKEQLGGFYLLECDDLDTAIHWAARIPHPHGRVEVRPIMEMG